MVSRVCRVLGLAGNREEDAVLSRDRKTILAAIVIDELTVRFANDPTIGIAFIYCNFRQQNRQSAIGLLASVLKQLPRRHSSLPDDIRALYNRHSENRMRPSLQDISTTLQSVATTYSRDFIVIDALDECRVSSDSLTTFLSEIFNLKKCQGNIFTTSRDIQQNSREACT